MLECKQSQNQQFFAIEGQLPSGLIRSKIRLIRDPIIIYTLTMFGADWSLFADASVQTKSNMAIFLIQVHSGPISSTTELILDLIAF